MSSPSKKVPRSTSPTRTEKGKINFFGNLEEDRTFSPYDPDEIAPYFTVVDTPEEADAALVMMESPPVAWGITTTPGSARWA